MAAMLKGKVIRMQRPLMRVKLISGREFWTLQRPNIDVHDFVWVAWDYTEDKPAQILTKTEMEDLSSRSTEFSPLPAVEDEGPETKEEIDSEDTNYERLEEIIKSSGYEVSEYDDDESFSDPKVDVSEEYEVRSFSDPCNEG
jgi:hypothetical protein